MSPSVNSGGVSSRRFPLKRFAGLRSAGETQESGWSQQAGKAMQIENAA
jgi:hypothetical protein